MLSHSSRRIGVVAWQLSGGSRAGQSSTVCVESRIEQSSSVYCYSYYAESDNDAVDRRRSHFVIVG